MRLKKWTSECAQKENTYLHQNRYTNRQAKSKQMTLKVVVPFAYT